MRWGRSSPANTGHPRPHGSTQKRPVLRVTEGQGGVRPRGKTEVWNQWAAGLCYSLLVTFAQSNIRNDHLPSTHGHLLPANGKGRGRDFQAGWKEPTRWLVLFTEGETEARGMCSGQVRELVEAGPTGTGSARSPAAHCREAGWFPLTPTNADLSLGEASAGRGGCPFSTAAVSPAPTRGGPREGPARHHQVPRGRPLFGRQRGPLRANREPTVWSQLPGAVPARGRRPGADTHRLAFRTYNTERLPAPHRASWPWHLPPGISPSPKL